ncbi:hypothetical protein C8R46DRAFT_1043669 [Mycena filopes]|nr:hypothetical protein C8R46DRAFT_1043669 [Mycena filopes]
MALSSSIWVALSFGSNGRVIVWDSVPDTAQLPLGSVGSMSLLDMQSSTCSPPCASSGCSSCDEGISGTGRCLSPPVANPLSACNCLNGECNAMDPVHASWLGPGCQWNGVRQMYQWILCDFDRRLQVCALGCTTCADGTGNCLIVARTLPGSE